ncbi:TetR/AcrR family transcriptional regulator [Halomonas sp. SSL-5]|uniref:TetR/AcrR family transcriptional regulator n=1 Tax=Halomonas sp. SSL-5 TaxID=3065855 RepID=UPI002739A55A|nr:TetR/AcrR family transcriptional regulator [Halomonas sp. SSL-5]MDY7115022.1 TetR/AcrR family transcriptional regulator [Halomonas sp. SSL-5]
MTRGRPIAFSPDQATSAAMRVFWQYGFEAASTRDLLEAMSISRSSLYQAFGNKEQLFLESLRRYREALLARLQRRLDTAPSAMSCLETLFGDTADEAGSERAALGCLIFNSATELGQRGDPPAEHARESLAAINAFFQRAVLQAQAEGDIALERDTEALAGYLTMGMAGLRTLLKSGADARQARQSVDLLLETLKRPPPDG